MQGTALSLSIILSKYKVTQNFFNAYSFFLFVNFIGLNLMKKKKKKKSFSFFGCCLKADE